jgi:hypothetical protein
VAVSVAFDVVLGILCHKKQCELSCGRIAGCRRYSNKAGRHAILRTYSKSYKICNFQAPVSRVRLVEVCVTTGQKFQARPD